MGTLKVIEHAPDGTIRDLVEGMDFTRHPGVFMGFTILNKRAECEYTWSFEMGTRAV